MGSPFRPDLRSSSRRRQLDQGCLKSCFLVSVHANALKTGGGVTGGNLFAPLPGVIALNHSLPLLFVIAHSVNWHIGSRGAWLVGIIGSRALALKTSAVLTSLNNKGWSWKICHFESKSFGFCIKMRLQTHGGISTGCLCRMRRPMVYVFMQFIHSSLEFPFCSFAPRGTLRSLYLSGNSLEPWKPRQNILGTAGVDFVGLHSH